MRATMQLANEFSLLALGVADGTRPADAWGATATPVQNAYGTPATILTALAKEAFALRLIFSNCATAGAARDMLATIVIDPAGGTSWTDFITDLLVTGASVYRTGGIEYYFPIYIPAGASLGFKTSVNNATVGTSSCAAIAYCQPSRPDGIQVGKFVRSFGATVASSAGTGITAGGVSEGAFVEIGTLADRLWYWEVGMGINNSTITSTRHNVDIAIGDATNKKTVISNIGFNSNTSEEIWKMAARSLGIGASGDKVYGRAQAGPNATVTGVSLMAYGVGG